MRMALSIGAALFASAAVAQQLPAPIVKRLNAPPWRCTGPDLALVPCGRARIADECRFRAAHLAACGAAGPKAQAARAGLQSCQDEANPERGGGMAAAFLAFDKAAAASAAAATPACAKLRGVPPAPGEVIDTWNARGPPQGWLA